MFDQQPADARSRIPHVGTYRRVLPISIERMYENALDWEHLPHLHASSFSSIEMLDAGPWGWRAGVMNARGEASVLELALDRASRRWITRNLEGANAGAEIWTHAFAVEPRRVDIVVDFFVPDVPDDARDRVGAAYARAYERLYDEDVAMMTERQRQIDARLDNVDNRAERVDLGARADLNLPVVAEVTGRRYVVAESAGELVVYPAVCPHQLGPLEGGALDAGIVECPWHGYRFDVRTGDCVSGQVCRLNHVPRLHEEAGRVVLSREPD
jgi:nitrite reductase/ring-hydroxylating ferredoxin subunit